MRFLNGLLVQLIFQKSRIEEKLRLELLFFPLSLQMSGKICAVLFCEYFHKVFLDFLGNGLNEKITRRASHYFPYEFSTKLIGGLLFFW